MTRLLDVEVTPVMASGKISRSGGEWTVGDGIRAGCLMLFVLWCYPRSRSLLDEAVAELWSLVVSVRFFHWPLCEALVATLGFWVSAMFFETLHLAWPAALQHRIRTHGGGETQRPRIFVSLPFFLKTKVGGSLVYLGAIFLYHTLLRSKPPLPALPPTFTRLAGELACGVFLYDLLFTPLHWLMHNSSSRRVRQLHRVHHDAKGTLSAGATVHHSLVDGGLQVRSSFPPKRGAGWDRSHSSLWPRYL
jgi:hypothetical protein